MTLADKIDNLKDNILGIPADMLVHLKDVLFQKEKGESIRVHTRPETKKEAYAQGYYGVRSNVTLVSVDSLERVLNQLCNIPDEDPNAWILTEAMTNIAIGSASTKFRRGESTSQILQNAKPDMNMGMTNIRSGPTGYGFEDKDDPRTKNPSFNY